ncbi:MAG: hypothetical protein NZ936_15445, partial [Alphaproteobacteria bacterium]|nr:hypothetical protein [Alphaproteobacteria bacterium]
MFILLSACNIRLLAGYYRKKGTLRDYGTGFHLKVKAVQVVQLLSAYTKITDGLRLGTDFDSLIQAVGQHQKAWSFLAQER